MVEPQLAELVPRQEVVGRRGGVLAWLEYVAFRCVVGLASRCGARGRAGIAALLARVAKALDRRHTRAARAFVTQAFGAELTELRREELVLAAWRHLFQLTLDDARFNAVVIGPHLLEHFEVVMCAEARAALAAREGVMVVGPHVGMWEAVPAVCVALGFKPLYVVSRPPHNRPLSRHAQRVREARGYRVMHRHGAVETMTKVAQAGGSIGLMLDQRAHGKTVIAPFFGRPAHCERAVAVLLRRLRMPVVFVACYRTATPFRYRAEFTSVIRPEQFAHASPEVIAAAVNRELERLIRAAPEQYFWLHDRYRNAPELSAGAGEP